MIDGENCDRCSPVVTPPRERRSESIERRVRAGITSIFCPSAFTASMSWSSAESAMASPLVPLEEMSCADGRSRIRPSICTDDEVGANEKTVMPFVVRVPVKVTVIHLFGFCE